MKKLLTSGLPTIEDLSLEGEGAYSSAYMETDLMHHEKGNGKGKSMKNDKGDCVDKHNICH